MVMQLPTSLTVSCTQESLWMQRNGKGTLNSSSNREYHSKKLSLKPTQDHQVWVGKAAYALPASHHYCAAHTADLNCFCVCVRLCCVLLYSHTYLPTKPAQKHFCFLHCTRLWQTRGQLYLVWFFIPYCCCTVNTFQTRIRIPQSYQTIRTGTWYDIPWPTGKWTQSTSVNWQGKNTWRDHRNLSMSCSLGC